MIKYEYYVYSACLQAKSNPLAIICIFKFLCMK